MGSRDIYGRPLREPLYEESVVSRRTLLRLTRTRLGQGTIDHGAATERVRRGWERDGHEALLRRLEPVADTMVELAGIGPGQRVLDVGAGDGNLALAAARRGALVEACDLCARMVERGRARCRQEGFDVHWSEADVQALPQPAACFDAVLSCFGASLAPHALQAAHELARVARPGGVVAVSAWSPRGLPGRLDEVVEPHAPRPAGVPRPSAWGTEQGARRRLQGVLADVEVRTRTVTLRFDSVDAAFDALSGPHGLDAEPAQALRPCFERALASCNNRPPAVEIDARYLIALGRRPVTA